MNKFKDMIDHCGIRDAGYSGDQFTWFKHFHRDYIWERLDRFLLNIEMDQLCAFFEIHHL